MTDEIILIFKQLAASGPFGVLIAGLLIWVYRLTQARDEDAKRYTQFALETQEKVAKQIEKLTHIVDTIEKHWNRHDP